uniref:Moesin/ezrin/radixin homolog 1 n=1 Tax=Strongyloides papillosus TaxID=174720 RepID=A0A0N5BR16_STREA
MRNMSSTIPKGVGAPPVPGLDPKKGKLMCIKVRMLDDTVAVFHLGHKADGQALFDEVCRHLNLIESDYFGLEFIDCYGNRCWLDKDKSILRQITTTHSDARFYFIVKFYPPNSTDIEEEYTKYLISLQLRRDLGRGELLCNENTAALLISYFVQADCGDYSQDDYPDHTYLSSISFIPKQTPGFLMKVMENHKNIIGMSPAECDLLIFETARKCEFFGVKLHPCRDIEGTSVSLSVAHIGVKVYHQIQCISTFSWAKIRKLSFKRKKLLIKLHPENYQFYKETIEFYFETRNECKTFWKKCVEHHAFFRCSEIVEPKKDNTKLFSRGSSFRYHGRTQKQLIDYVREHRKRREPFSRAICSGQLTSNRDISNNYSSTLNSNKNFNVDEEFIPKITMRNKQRESIPLCESKSASKIEETPYQKQIYDDRNYYINTSKTDDMKTKSMYVKSYNSKCNYMSDYESSEIEIPNVIYSKVYSSKNKTSDENKNDENLNQLYATVLPHETNDYSDNISLSMPNVTNNNKTSIEVDLDNDSKRIPFKSASGENFNNYEMRTNRNLVKDFDYDSEGSYKLCDDTSSASDILSSVISSTDNRALNTVFTTKRIGEVIVKTVVKQKDNDNNKTDGNKKSKHRKSDEIQTNIPPKTVHVSSKHVFPNSIPIPIDGPLLTSETKEESSLTTNFINESNNIQGSSSTFKPISQQNIPIKVQRPKIIDNEKSDDKSQIYGSINIQKSSDKPIVFPKPSVSIPIASKDNIYYSKPSTTTATSSSSTVETPTSKPLPGKIIHKSNIVIKAKTPQLDFTSLNEENEEDKVKSQPKQKPIVPPKPKNLSNTSDINKIVDEIVLTGETITNIDKPTMISVESEDQPDVKKIHLLEGEIPYTLTVRHINTTGGNKPGTPTTSTPDNTPFPPPPTEIQMCSIKQIVKDQFSSGMYSSRRKSLEFVQRKRLPSQDSFSSQDHSISPTTPDTGNILEYINKKRSASQEKGNIIKKTSANETKSKVPLDTSALDEFLNLSLPESHKNSQKVVEKESTSNNPSKEQIIKNKSPPFIDETASENSDKEKSPNATENIKTRVNENGVLETDF